MIVKSTVPGTEFYPVPLRQVRVAGAIGERVDRTIDGNLLKLDWDGDFLASFESKAVTPDSGHPCYIGLGKTLEALVRFAAYRPGDDLESLRRRIINAVLALQLDDGYLGFFAEECRIKPLWDVHEMAYLAMALIVNFELFGEQASLDAATRTADYIIARVTPEMAHRGWVHSVLMDTCGLDRMLLALHRATGEQRYLDYVVNAQRLIDWDLPIVEGRHGDIEGHAYAYLIRCLAQMELYNLCGDARLLSQTRGVLDYMTHNGGMVITGACGQSECWHSDQDGTGELGETCTSAYQIRLYDKLIRLHGDLSYGDMMERTIYNALFAAQSPDGRRIRYYAPFEGERVYWKGDTYCCPGNFRRIVAQLPQMVYYRFDGGIAVNLYAQSRVTTDLAELQQITDYPLSGSVTIEVTPLQAEVFTVRLRRPRWCEDMRVQINGAPASCEIARKWSIGDRITIDMKMDWRLVRGFAKQAGRVAVMRGPIVYSSATANHTAEPIDRGDIARLSLRPFAHPDGTATYFTPVDPTDAVDDELLDAIMR